MPLPPNSTISLQAHSRPGEGTTTVPKIAMIIRMTEETLDALQNLSGADRMDFEFGDKSGIVVRDQFFPMRYDKEKDNQELFIRTTTATRPNPPLKLNANVVGKFAVEQMLSDKITQRVHNATAAAAKQKAERKTIMLDTPPPVTQAVPQKSAPKKKGPLKSTGRSTPTIVKSYALSLPQQTPSSSPSSAVSLPKELATTYRQRLVHYLALGAATVQDIFKEFDSSGMDHNIRSGIMDLLIEVAEQEQVPRKTTTSSQATKWQLKLQTWLEVRPYQYSGYTDNVRTKVARTARTRLVSLKIPESDPAWGHVKFRASGQSATSSNANTVQRPINGAKSATAASTRPTAGPTSVPFKANPSLNQAAKPVRSTKGKERETDTEKEEGELSASQTPPRVPASVDRRQPGSRPSGASTPLMQPPQVPVSPRPPPSSQTPSVPPKRTGPVDARGLRRPEPSERARPAPPITPPVPSERKPSIQPKREVVPTKKERASLSRSEIAAPPSVNSLQPVKDRDLARRERDRESDVESLRKARRETERESDRESARGRDKDRELKVRNLGKERERERGQPRDKTREREQPSSRPVKSATKRKPSESSSEESSDWGYEERKNIRKSTLPSTNSSTTKVKTEREIVPVRASVSSRKTSTRDSPPPKQKVKREPSPIPLSKTKPVPDRKVIAGSSSAVPKTSKKEVKTDSAARPTNGKSLKRQRQSIDFTSSSDDEEKEPVPKSSKLATKATASSHPLPTKNSATAVSGVSEPRPRPSKHLPPQSKHEQMRLRYSTIYSEYIMVFQKLVAQKQKFDTILRYGSASPSEQSDSESDMADLEGLEELRKRYQRLHDELEDIKRIYMA